MGVNCGEFLQTCVHIQNMAIGDIREMSLQSSACVGRLLICFKRLKSIVFAQNACLFTVLKESNLSSKLNIRYIKRDMQYYMFFMKFYHYEKKLR